MSKHKSETFAESIRERFGFWLAVRLELLGRGTTTRLADALDVPASRITQYATSDLAPKSAMAFRIGQELGRLGDNASSGLIALATAYPSDTVDLIAKLGSVNSRVAVISFATIPSHIKWLEHFWVNEMVDDGTMYSADRRDMIREYINNGEIVDDLPEECTTESFREDLDRANKIRLQDLEPKMDLAEPLDFVGHKIAWGSVQAAIAAAGIIEKSDPVYAMQIAWIILKRWAVFADATSLAAHWERLTYYLNPTNLSLNGYLYPSGEPR